MDLLAELKDDIKAKEVKKLAIFVLENDGKFDDLMDIFLSGDFRTAHRASNVLNLCVQAKDQLVYRYLDIILEKLKKTPHDSFKRNSIRMLQFIDIPEDYMGEIADLCFQYLDSEREGVAVRVFSMTVLYNITRKFPDIKDELKMMIEDHLPYGSAGMKSRGRKILKLLEKI